jgi:hypothetical protein
MAQFRMLITYTLTLKGQGHERLLLHNLTKHNAQVTERSITYRCCIQRLSANNVNITKHVKS